MCIQRNLFFFFKRKKKRSFEGIALKTEFILWNLFVKEIAARNGFRRDYRCRDTNVKRKQVLGIVLFNLFSTFGRKLVYISDEFDCSLSVPLYFFCVQNATTITRIIHTLSFFIIAVIWIRTIESSSQLFDLSG